MVVILIMAVGAWGYMVWANQNQIAQNPPQPVPPITAPSQTINQYPQTSPTPTSTIQIEPTATATSLQNGASLQDIKYTLPQGWKAEIRKGGANNEEGLSITPLSGGGYFWIIAYDYPGDLGRKEYYCKISKVCIKETYFTEMSIGNISGYMASALDNSGGGFEYFGSKGNKFYIISSYNPPSPNEFEKDYKKVLDSLVF